jgi:RNA polymerase sigma-70 factor (ECF subfamily)
MRRIPTTDAKRRFELLVAECLDPLYRTAYRLTGKADEARELAHEAFLRARRALSHLPHDANARAWLFRILRNVWVDHIRKSARDPQLLPFDEIEAFADVPTPKLDAMDKESRRRLEQYLDDQVLAAIQSLPHDMRLALLFQTFGGLNYEEISQALECPIGTVMSRLHRAKARLREQLASYAATYRGVSSQTLKTGGDRHAQA